MLYSPSEFDSSGSVNAFAEEFYSLRSSVINDEASCGSLYVTPEFTHKPWDADEVKEEVESTAPVTESTITAHSYYHRARMHYQEGGINSILQAGVLLLDSGHAGNSSSSLSAALSASEPEVAEVAEIADIVSTAITNRVAPELVKNWFMIAEQNLGYARLCLLKIKNPNLQTPFIARNRESLIFDGEYQSQLTEIEGLFQEIKGTHGFQYFDEGAFYEALYQKGKASYQQLFSDLLEAIDQNNHELFLSKIVDLIIAIEQINQLETSTDVEHQPYQNTWQINLIRDFFHDHLCKRLLEECISGFDITRIKANFFSQRFIDFSSYPDSLLSFIGNESDIVFEHGERGIPYLKIQYSFSLLHHYFENIKTKFREHLEASEPQEESKFEDKQWASDINFDDLESTIKDCWQEQIWGLYRLSTTRFSERLVLHEGEDGVQTGTVLVIAAEKFEQIVGQGLELERGVSARKPILYIPARGAIFRFVSSPDFKEMISYFNDQQQIMAEIIRAKLVFPQENTGQSSDWCINTPDQKKSMSEVPVTPFNSTPEDRTTCEDKAEFLFYLRRRVNDDSWLTTGVCCCFFGRKTPDGIARIQHIVNSLGDQLDNNEQNLDKFNTAFSQVERILESKSSEGRCLPCSFRAMETQQFYDQMLEKMQATRPSSSGVSVSPLPISPLPHTVRPDGYYPL